MPCVTENRCESPGLMVGYPLSSDLGEFIKEPHRCTYSGASPALLEFNVWHYPERSLVSGGT